MKTEPFFHDADVVLALRQFEDAPLHRTFSRALASLLLQAAQKTLSHLQSIESLRSYWRTTSAPVVLYELIAYLWCMASFDLSAAFQYTFEEDREAVQRGMLNGMSQANAMLREKWFGFSPEIYALSRLLLYPKDLPAAAEHFCRVFAASEGRDFPLFPGELPPPTSTATLNGVQASDFSDAIHENLHRELRQAITALAIRYLESRID